MPSSYGGYGAGGSSLEDRLGPSYSEQQARDSWRATAVPRPGPMSGGGGGVGVSGGGGGVSVFGPADWNDAGVGRWYPAPRVGGGSIGDQLGSSAIPYLAGGGGSSRGGGNWATDLTGYPVSRSGGPVPNFGSSWATALGPTGNQGGGWSSGNPSGASPSVGSSRRGGFLDWLGRPTTGIFGQFLAGQAANAGMPAYGANVMGTVANVAPGIFNPFLGLANTILGWGANRFNNPMTGQNFLSPDFRQNMPYDPGVRYPPVYENFTPSGGEQTSGGGRGWFGGGSGWTITETTPSAVPEAM